MPEDLPPSFRLYADPVGEGRFVRSEAACDACGQARGWGSNAILHTSDRSKGAMCPWCIVEGTAVRKWGGTFNDVAGPLPADRLAEVSERTPGIATWQEVPQRLGRWAGGLPLRVPALRHRNGRLGQRLSVG